MTTNPAEESTMEEKQESWVRQDETVTWAIAAFVYGASVVMLVWWVFDSWSGQ